MKLKVVIVLVCLMLVSLGVAILLKKYPTYYLFGEPSTWYFRSDGTLSESYDPTKWTYIIHPIGNGVTFAITIKEVTETGSVIILYDKVASWTWSGGNYSVTIRQFVDKRQFASEKSELEISLLYNAGSGWANLGSWRTVGLNASGLESSTWQVTYVLYQYVAESAVGISIYDTKIENVVFFVLKADFTFTPAAPKVYDSITFTSASRGAIVNYIWDFGDGVTKNGQYLNKVAHSYTKCGNYNVVLKVSDGTFWNTVTKTVYVADIPPKITLITGLTFPELSDVYLTVKTTKADVPYTTEVVFTVTYMNGTVYLILDNSTDSSGYLTFRFTSPVAGDYMFNFAAENTTLNVQAKVLPVLQMKAEYDSTQYYSLIGDVDLNVKIAFSKPVTALYDVLTNITFGNIKIPASVYKVEEGFFVTGKVYSVFDDTVSRTVTVNINVESSEFYANPNPLAFDVKMEAPKLDFWISDLTGTPLPTNVKLGAKGFYITLLMSEPITLTEENIYLKISSPDNIYTTETLNIKPVSNNAFYVDFVFSQVGVYEVTVSLVNLPVYSPTRTYVYTVQELTGDTMTQYLQEIFFMSIVLTVIYALLKRRK